MGNSEVKAKGKSQKAKIIIKKDIYDKVINLCLNDPSKESCGILVGEDKIIDKIYPLTNISDNPHFCYLIDPKEQLKVFKELRRENLQMLAIFHSHIDSAAYPSKRDVELAFYPESSYLIISLSDNTPTARSFKISDGSISEEELVMEQ